MPGFTRVPGTTRVKLTSYVILMCRKVYEYMSVLTGAFSSEISVHAGFVWFSTHNVGQA